MNHKNNKSSNTNKNNDENKKKNDNIIDISLNFIDNFTNINNDNIFDNSSLHNGVEKTIEELIEEICNEFDEVLKITTQKKYTIDNSYNLLLKDIPNNNLKNNENNYFIMNNTNTDKDKIPCNKKSISYYLNSYNYNYHKQRRGIVNKNLTNTLLDIDKNYDDFNLKQYALSNNVTSIPKPLKIIKKKVEINVTLDSIADLIKLADDYPLSPDIEYNIDMQAIHLIRPDIVRLNDMIGMHNLKENILDQILYFIQKLHVHKNENVNNEFMHTVIYGPPGTGKTETAHIIGGIYSKLGILKNNVFRKVTRADLIAGYLGQTAIKTTEVVKSAIGGVLFIDEAYALGNTEKKDSFAKECIDTLCEALSNHKHELMVIIAGYEEDLKKCFFSYNQGLDSRFIWRFKIDDYTPEELQLIFNKKVKDCEWTIDKISTSWFQKHKNYFKYFGRDMETLLSKVKIAHSRRVFCLPESEKRNITLKDIKKGFKLYIKNDEVRSRVEKQDNPLVNMYL
jgi:SpoVK/Ycf46/Vps4 family AAA+-type ATPase